MFCRHQWQTLGHKQVTVILPGDDRKLVTDVSLRCTRCGQPKVKRLRGLWSQ